VVFAYGNGEGIYLLSGDGSLNKKVIGGYYYQPALSPDGTKIACVYDKSFQITIFNLDANRDLVGQPKNVYNSQAYSQESKPTPASCPVWSLDGQKLYFLNQNHLILYDYQLMRTTSLFDFPENQTGGQTQESGNMKLSKEGDSLFCMMSEGEDKLDFWTVNLSANQGTQVAGICRALLSDFKFPPEISGDVLENLFGSAENPAWGPIPSPDRRYFFYFRRDPGFPGKKRIEGFDRTTKEKFDVATLGYSLFGD
jgi:hypothetical protein